MKLVHCQFEEHAGSILEIFNHAIENTTALYDYNTRNMVDMKKWFQAKEAGNYPVIGAIDEAGELKGFTTYGKFRERDAYKYTVEHSVYVHHSKRSMGIGKMLMHALIQKAREQNYHVLIGVIDTQNESSIRFHEQLGFKLTGHFREIGYKFQTWLDCAVYQMILETPLVPNEDKSRA